jgi:hypothetical protein
LLRRRRLLFSREAPAALWISLGQRRPYDQEHDHPYGKYATHSQFSLLSFD